MNVTSRGTSFVLLLVALHSFAGASMAADARCFLYRGSFGSVAPTATRNGASYHLRMVISAGHASENATRRHASSGLRTNAEKVSIDPF